MKAGVSISRPYGSQAGRAPASMRSVRAAGTVEPGGCYAVVLRAPYSHAGAARTPPAEARRSRVSAAPGAEGRSPGGRDAPRTDRVVHGESRTKGRMWPPECRMCVIVLPSRWKRWRTARIEVLHLAASGPETANHTGQSGVRTALSTSFPQNVWTAWAAAVRMAGCVIALAQATSSPRPTAGPFPRGRLLL